ncbi:MAG: nitrogen regulation protein NR(II) [Pseudomonadota bacterium]|nr:nitrogen regulation protein NR(II) [Pseudomonadota bacterium]
MAESGLAGGERPILDSLPHPVLMVNVENRVAYANLAAESFFRSSAAFLTRYDLDHFVPFGSPVLTLVEQVRIADSSINEYKVDISSPRIGRDKVVDVYASPVTDTPGAVVLMFQPRSMADKIDRQLTHRGAARTVMGLAAMLAHEIKNPLSGIRGAAQLLEMSANDDDRALTRLITDEADRIVKIVDRMEVFSDERPIERQPVNIHSVLEHVKRLSSSGFARAIRISEEYDPSLPPVYGNRDQLIQVFLNLAKNAAEALSDTPDAEIVFSTAFRPGIHLSVPGSSEKVSLPLEFCVRDNGPGVPDEIRSYIFDPFVTTKTNGSGLGLALVAKIVGDHGGVIECDSEQRKTVFRILLPVWRGRSGEAIGEDDTTFRFEDQE